MLTFDKKISIDGVAVILAAIGFTFWFGSFNERASATEAVVRQHGSDAGRSQSAAGNARPGH